MAEAKEKDTAYFIIRLDSSGNVYDYGIYSSCQLERDKEHFTGEDVIVASAPGKDFADAFTKLKALINKKLDG